MQRQHMGGVNGFYRENISPHDSTRWHPMFGLQRSTIVGDGKGSTTLAHITHVLVGHMLLTVYDISLFSSILFIVKIF